nr:MAG TPA: hypothetical protein [Caudoviricetes sp.]
MLIINFQKFQYNILYHINGICKYHVWDTNGTFCQVPNLIKPQGINCTVIS